MNFIKLLIKICTVRRFHNSIEILSILENYHFAEFGRVIVNVQLKPTAVCYQPGFHWFI
jgi:hypothetical protein